MLKNFLYTPFEFFYDYSFKDYDYFQHRYVLQYNQQLDHDLFCPERIVLRDQIHILAYKPEMISEISLNDVIGVFNAEQDNVGIYGSYKFIDNFWSQKIVELLKKDSGLYKLEPYGNVIYDQNQIAIEYVLRALYLRYR